MTTAGRRTPPLSDEDVRATLALRKGSDTVESGALHSAAFADLVVEAGEDKTVLLATIGNGQGLYGRGPASKLRCSRREREPR